MFLITNHFNQNESSLSRTSFLLSPPGVQSEYCTGLKGLTRHFEALTFNLGTKIKGAESVWPNKNNLFTVNHKLTSSIGKSKMDSLHKV